MFLPVFATSDGWIGIRSIVMGHFMSSFPYLMGSGVLHRFFIVDLCAEGENGSQSAGLGPVIFSNTGVRFG